MDPEAVLNLFDSLWFYLGISEEQPKTSNSSIPETDPRPQIQENPAKSKFSKQLTIHTRSKSEQPIYLNTGFNLDTDISSSSSNPELKPHLQTILSEREFSAENPKTQKLKKPSNGLNKKKKGSYSKSLSELEFEEVKGFMDLGFVFSEDDKDSNLVEIIPGLQRLGHEDEEVYGPRERPYLSEAWEILEERNEKKPLMNWRVPVVSNEIDMKYNLKWWAHSVASAVR